MKIGNIELKTNVVLGPMAGFTDLPFRALCKEQGASLIYTEMVSAKALYYRNKGSEKLLMVDEAERPAALQLFGSEPELMAQEAAKLEDGPYDIFDINMGCPVPKVVNNHEGSALMLDPLLAGKIIEAMAKALAKPVTVKIRKGFDDAHVNAAELAHIAEESGAAAVTVHGRTRQQYYSGKADWDIIAKVKAAVHIPVIGNGDVRSGKDAASLMEQTGCDGVMVARAARGNPWIFREIDAYLKGEPVPARPTPEELRAMIERHLEMMVSYAGEWSAIRQMRKHVGFYCAGYPNATHIRRAINRAETMDEFRNVLELISSQSSSL